MADIGKDMGAGIGEDMEAEIGVDIEGVEDPVKHPPKLCAILVFDKMSFVHFR